MIKRNILHKINIPLLIVLLSNSILDARYNLAIDVVIFAMLFIKNKFKAKASFPGSKIYFSLLVMGLFIGVINCLTRNNNWYILFKHSYYFLMPFIYWNIGYRCQSKDDKKKDGLYTIVAFSGAFALIDIISTLFSITQTGSMTSVYLYRETVGLSGGASIFSFALLVYFYNEIQMKKRWKNLILIVSFLSLLMHFSRTSIVQIAIYVLFIMPYTKINSKVKYISAGIGAFVVIAMMFPDLLGSFINKALYSFTEVNFNNTNWSEYTINNNWRGYEAYCALKQFKSSGLIAQIFGNGFGFELDAFGYESLVTDEDGLVFLHNGYFTNLMLWGVIGFLAYFAWIYATYKTGNKYNSKRTGQFHKATSVMLAVCTYFVHGPLFSTTLAMYFLILGVIRRKDKNESMVVKL